MRVVMRREGLQAVRSRNRPSRLAIRPTVCAEAWLADYLTEHGTVRSKDAKTDAGKAGIKERTLQRAAKNLRVCAEARGFPRVTWWALPSGANTSDATPDTQNLGATGATGRYLHKQNGATGEIPQSRQALRDGATDADAASNRVRDVSRLETTDRILPFVPVPA